MSEETKRGVSRRNLIRKLQQLGLSGSDETDVSE